MSASPRSPSPSAPWLHHPAVDLLVGCGAWSLPLLGLTFLAQREHGSSVTFAFYALAIFCNNPHYMATIYRAYGRSGDFQKYRFFTLYVTAIVLVTVVLVHAVPALFPWVVTVYLTWSPWHYTGQNFGIAQMFIRRSGSKPDVTARQLLYASYAASFAVWVLTLHSITDTDANFLSLRIPERIATPLQLLFTLVFIGAGAGAFFRLSKSVPLRALSPAMLLSTTQFLWFVGPALLTRFGAFELPASYFSAGALAFMHCAQYLWITTYYAQRENAGASHRDAHADKKPFSFTRYYLVLVIGGIALFVPGPWLASRVLGRDLVESFLIFAALVNLHHFILDGAIWKLRDGRIARLLLGKTAVEDASEAAIRTPSFNDHLHWLFGKSWAARLALGAFSLLVAGIGALDLLQYYSTQRSSDATTLARAEFLNPSDPRVYFRRAQLLLAAGDAAAARAQLEHALAINPRNAPAQHLLGEIIFRSGDTAAALAHYDRMAELFRPDLSIAINRGLLAQHTGSPAAAVSRFEEALRIAPHRNELHFLLAEASMASGDTERAIKQYELFATLFEEDPGEPLERDRMLDGYLKTGLSLGAWQRARGDLSAAETRLQRTADIAVRFHRFIEASEALTALAEVQATQGRADLAEKNRAAAGQAAQLAKNTP